MLRIEYFRLTQITAVFKIIVVGKVALAHSSSFLGLSSQSTIAWKALTMQIYFLILDLEPKVKVSIGFVSLKLYSWTFKWVSSPCVLTLSLFWVFISQRVFVCPDLLS